MSIRVANINAYSGSEYDEGSNNDVSCDSALGGSVSNIVDASTVVGGLTVGGLRVSDAWATGGVDNPVADEFGSYFTA